MHISIYYIKDRIYIDFFYYYYYSCVMFLYKENTQHVAQLYKFLASHYKLKLSRVTTGITDQIIFCFINVMILPTDYINKI